MRNGGGREGDISDFVVGSQHGFVREIQGDIRQMLHSAELHVLQASTLTNDGVAKGARGVPEGQTARPGTENSPKFTRPVAPPSSPFNL